MGGPILALLAAAFSFAQHFRPQKFARTLIIVALTFWIPLIASALASTGFFILIFRPGTIFISFLAGFGGLVHIVQNKLPDSQATAPILLLIAATWDTLTLIYLLNMGNL